MRIAYVGHEVFANCAMALLDDGHTITHIFSPWTPGFKAPVSLRDVAKRAGVRIRRQPVRPSDIDMLAAEQVEVLLCMSYPSRLPVDETTPIRAVNIHAAPLPEGRGPAPYHWAILTGRTSTAVTAHQMIHRFDAGPILLQAPVDIRPDETADSLRYRCRDATVALVVDLVRDFDALWEARQPQGKGTYCKLPRRSDCTLDWNLPTEELGRMLRAFPPGGRYANLGGREMTVGHAECWGEGHALGPGTVVSRNGSRYLVATADGMALVHRQRPSPGDAFRRKAWPFVRPIHRLLRLR